MQIHNIFLMSKPNKLPAYQQSKFIMEVIDKERVTVVSGKTGCGKSTQIPQAILRAHPDAKVAVCEPRRLAATSLAERVSSEMNSKVGGLVGYHIGMEPRISENSRIIFMTYGIMIQKLMHNDKLDYTHIILDEVHERSLEMDFTFMALRKILDDQKVKRKIKLVIMSATINSVSFKEYFSYHKATEQFVKPSINIDFSNFFETSISKNEVVQKPKSENFKLCGGYDIPDVQRHKVQVFYLDELLRERNDSEKKLEEYDGIERNKCIISQSFNLFVIELIKKFCGKKDGDILVFLPGIGQIKKLKSLLQADEWIRGSDKRIVTVHSAYSEKLNKQLYNTKYEKIILATNIGESSITLPQCKLVIDFALTRKNITNSESRGFNQFVTMRASKSNLIQRAGRVGRVSDGQVYRLISKKKYNTLKQFEEPEIKLVSLEMTILKIKLMDKTFKGKIFEDHYDLLLSTLDPPSPVQIHAATHFLVTQKALLNKSSIGSENQKYEGKYLRLSKIGNFIANIPCSYSVSKMILLSLQLGIENSIIDIASILMCSKQFYTFEEKRNTYFMAKIIEYDKLYYNDFMAQKRIYSDWKKRFFYPRAKSYLQKLERERGIQEFDKDPYYKDEKVETANQSAQQTQMQQKQQNEIEEFYEEQDEEEDYSRSDNFIDRFCRQRISGEQKNWLEERNINFGCFRQVLRINENIKTKLIRFNFDLEIEERKDDEENQLVLLCLALAFPEAQTQVSVYQNPFQIRQYPTYEEHHQPISIKLSEAITFQEFKEELRRYLYPETPKSVELKEGMSVQILAKSYEMYEKILLKKRYQPRLQCSKIFYKCLAENRKLKEINIKGHARKAGKNVHVHCQSVLSSGIEIDVSSKYFILTNSITESNQGNYHINSGALIEGKAYYAMRMLTCNSLKLGRHQEYGFIEKLKFDDQVLNLPFHLTKEIMDIVKQVRGAAVQITDKGNLKGKFTDEKKKLIQKLMSSEIPVTEKEMWEDVFQSQVNMFDEQALDWQQVLPSVEINFKDGDYYTFYNEWKKEEYKRAFQILRKNTGSLNPKIICAECYKNRVFKPIEQYENYDFDKRFMKVVHEEKRWIQINSKLYCDHGHNFGYLYDQKNAILIYGKVYCYFFGDIVYKIEESKRVMKEKEAKALKRSKELKKEMKEDWWFFNCKFCPKAINEKKKVFTIKRKENEPYERLLEKLEGHFYDDHHHHYIEQFVRTIN